MSVSKVNKPRVLNNVSRVVVCVCWKRPEHTLQRVDDVRNKYHATSARNVQPAGAFSPSWNITSRKVAVSQQLRRVVPIYVVGRGESSRLVCGEKSFIALFFNFIRKRRWWAIPGKLFKRAAHTGLFLSARPWKAGRDYITLKTFCAEPKTVSNWEQTTHNCFGDDDFKITCKKNKKVI